MLTCTKILQTHCLAKVWSPPQHILPTESSEIVR